MKIENTPPPRPTLSRKTGAPHAPKPAASRHDNSFHSPDDIRVDIVMAADPDSHDGPDYPGEDDDSLLDRETAIETAHTVSAWLASHALSLTSHRAARLQHLFAG
ncbi:hypothetical protein [Maricaulis maris]|uniref:Uncharacterized protein n=1 Tax=Maricaulis maris TaxID=74318 RepID=A0A495D3I9_9PROT|nr:hypothetical protein [Maricaulis maris]RKQ95530.1 hypothetical protein C7435_2633 [Maricaulis maris]